MVWECLMEAKGRFSSRRPSRYPLHGRNDMKTSKKRFSRQKHAHKQRKQGLSCHHAPPQSPQPSQEPRTPSIVSTVFNSPNGPIGPKSPKSPNGPKDGCSPSIPLPPNPPTFREKPIFRLFYALNLQSKSLRKLKNSIFRQTKRKKP